MMVPPVPTTVQVLASVQEMDPKLSNVPTDWSDQVAPPSSVRSINPELPTATAVLALITVTAFRSKAPKTTLVHVSPPSDDQITIPLVPAAKQVSSKQAMPLR